MRKQLTAAVLAAAIAAGLAPPAAGNSDVAAAVAAGVAGAAIGAALSKNQHKAKRARKAHFQPAPGITCYDYQAACYHDDGGFASKWTRRIYG